MQASNKQEEMRLCGGGNYSTRQCCSNGKKNVEKMAKIEQWGNEHKPSGSAVNCPCQSRRRKAYQKTRDSGGAHTVCSASLGKRQKRCGKRADGIGRTPDLHLLLQADIDSNEDMQKQKYPWSQ